MPPSLRVLHNVTFTDQALRCRSAGSLGVSTPTQMPRTPPPPLIHLSLVVGKPLRSAEGTLLGVAVDLTAQLVGGRARISGAIIRIDGGDTYVPAAELGSFELSERMTATINLSCRSAPRLAV